MVLPLMSWQLPPKIEASSSGVLSDALTMNLSPGMILQETSRGKRELIRDRERGRTGITLWSRLMIALSPFMGDPRNNVNLTR